MMRELDWYVRMARVTRMVEALAKLPAIIIGRGWEHVEKDFSPEKRMKALLGLAMSTISAMEPAHA